jgi:anhydro-N-acetylmuramic acid kinase
MVYSVIGLMSGSSLDGLDIAFVQFNKTADHWTFEILDSACYPYPGNWVDKLRNAPFLNALDYQLLHSAYGHYLGQQTNRFIQEKGLQFKVQLIGSHGHTVFHKPEQRMTAQLGDGASIAATTGIHVISDLRSMDIAFGGQGAPIVPIGEKMLFESQSLFLNLGGIANISLHKNAKNGLGALGVAGKDLSVAFDVCPANQVLNLLAQDLGKDFDKGGSIAESGNTDERLLMELNELEYYELPFPKSLANHFGTVTLYHLIKSRKIKIPDALRTYVEHICIQVKRAAETLVNLGWNGEASPDPLPSILVTGGGANNHFLIRRLKEFLSEISIQVIIPEAAIVEFKEAIIMAFMAVLRWREEINVLSSVTGSERDSIGGAIWIGRQD